MAERIDSVTGEWDEDGFHLRFATDDSEHELRVTDTTVAREVMRAVAPLLGWVAEEDRERAAYDRASPEERARVLGQPPEPCGHDGWVAECAQCEENARVADDLMRKAERENL